MSSDRRPKLRDVGTAPDVRFTFANERTFLAWSRTSLAVSYTHLTLPTTPYV